MRMYLKTTRWWKFIALLPFVYLGFVIFRGLYSANLFMQTQTLVGDKWETNFTNTPFYALDPTSYRFTHALEKGGATFSAVDVAMQSAIWGAFFLFIYSIIFVVLNKNAYAFMNWLIPLVLSFLLVGSTLYLFIKVSYTSVVFAHVNGTIQYHILVLPLNLVYTAWFTTQSITVLIASLVVVTVGIVGTLSFLINLFGDGFEYVPQSREERLHDIQTVRDYKHQKETEHYLRKISKNVK